MKILVFTMAYPNNVWPNNGVFVKQRITSVASLDGYNIKVVAPVPYCPPIGGGWRQEYRSVVREEVIDGLDVFHPRYLMTPKIGTSLYGYKMFLGSLNTVRQIRHDFDFDLISAHTVYPDGFAGMMLSQYFDRPFVVSARGTDINYLPQFRILRSLIKRTVNKASKVITVCEALKEELLRIEPDCRHVESVPNGVDSDHFYPVPTDEARRQLGLPDRTILLTVGSLIPRKGVHVLIESLASLRANQGSTDPLLVVIGDGSFRAELQDLVRSLDLQDNVTFVGEVPHSQLNLWYNACDIFCLASNREGWPNVVMEALACGKPVVATRVWGIPEIVKSDEYGILVEREPEAFADAIAEAIQTTWNHETITQYARSRSWSNAAKSMRRIFDAALAEQHPSQSVS